MQLVNGETMPAQATVLTKATLGAANLLDLNDADLATIIGVSGPTVSRYRHGGEIDPDREARESALLLVRLLRSLDPLVGSDSGKRKAWMRSTNTELGSVPATLIRKPGGLVQTVAYLEGIRATA